jgi:uncharacterized integral membrane protein
MRLFVSVLLLFAIPLIVFLFLNSEEQVTVNLGTVAYTDVPLWSVVFLAVVVGAVLVALIALVEGAAIRLANRKLRREVHKLETETNFLRTSSAREAVPPAPETRTETTRAPRDAEAPARTPHSAPVYSDEFEAYTDPD